MTNDHIFRMQAASYFMRHNQNINQDQPVDTKLDIPIIISQMQLSQLIADYLNDNIIEDNQSIDSLDVLDCLASLGIVLSGLDNNHHSHNYASLAYFYSLNNKSIPDEQSIPEVIEYFTQ